MWTDRPLIIDTDPGTDDAVALLVAAAEGLDVRLVVSTYGNVPHAYTKKNAVDLTGLLFPGVPVLYGADGPLSGSGHTAEYVHGENGVGGVRLRAFVPADIAQGGTDALYETVRQLGRPDYIALGPLTNLARLLAKYPQAQLGRVVVMAAGCTSRIWTAARSLISPATRRPCAPCWRAGFRRSSSRLTQRTRSSSRSGRSPPLRTSARRRTRRAASSPPSCAITTT